MKPQGIFYGWVVVAAVFTVLFVAFGVAYSFAAFFDSLEQEFQASRADVSWVFAICGFLYFGLGVVSGPLADRLRSKYVVAFGVVLIATGLIVAGASQSLWQVYLSYGVGVGVGVAFAYVPSVGAVQPWFEARRGLASGLAVAGIGAGTLVGPLVAHWLIEIGGWRSAYVAMGLIALIVGLAAAWLIEERPEAKGQGPDGGPLVVVSHDATRPVAGASLGQALRSRPFLLLYLATGLASFALFVPFVHLANYGRDHGLDEASAIITVSLIGLGSLLGRFFLGGLADRWGRRGSTAAMFAGLAVMTLWWLYSSTFWTLAVFAVLFGIFYGGYVALAPALMADYFGGRAISGIIGWLYSSVSFGTLLGPPLAGWIYDQSQSYVPVIIAGAVLCALGAAVTLAAPKLSQWRQQAPWFA